MSATTTAESGVDVDTIAPELVNPLRSEIVESEKCRIDLLKYKLIAVASLGAAGLGLRATGDSGTVEILALIPLVCVYIDMLCYHNTIRILIIGAYLRKHGYRYENFISGMNKVLPTLGLYQYRMKHCEPDKTKVLTTPSFTKMSQMVSNCHLCEHAVNPGQNGVGYLFRLEDMALFVSTVALSSMVAGFSCYMWKIHHGEAASILFLASVLGILVSFKVKYDFTLRLTALEKGESVVDGAGRVVDLEARDYSTMSPVIMNKKLSFFVSQEYTSLSLEKLRTYLERKGTFTFVPLPNGLFPAADVQEGSEYTGYSNVWVRDNVYVAHVLYMTGNVAQALKTVNSLAEWLLLQRSHFEKIIRNPSARHDVMNRPHIRFNGAKMSEIPTKWAHAENDALGYFLWIFSKLLRKKQLHLTGDNEALLALFPRYFKAIRYWKDEDSGHWEEARKVETSSIGVVIAGLRELLALFTENPAICPGAVSTVRNLVKKGEAVLMENLPFECRKGSPLTSRLKFGARDGGGGIYSEVCNSLLTFARKVTAKPLSVGFYKTDGIFKLDKTKCRYRRYDASLLFLIYPLEVVPEDCADAIVRDVKNVLLGQYGVRRYLGDTFWSPDYRDRVDESKRTMDVSENMELRNCEDIFGKEAQWCIFDPILSIIYGNKYVKTGDEGMLQQQIHHFNRSLGHLTNERNPFGELKCPELYFLSSGRYEANDVVPLLWTQANLLLAFHHMKKSLEVKERQ